MVQYGLGLLFVIDIYSCAQRLVRSAVSMHLDSRAALLQLLDLHLLLSHEVHKGALHGAAGARLRARLHTLCES